MDNFQDRRISTVDSERTQLHQPYMKVIKYSILNLIFIIFVAFATLNFIKKNKSCENDCELKFCSPYFLMISVVVLVVIGLVYSKIVKRYFGDAIKGNCITPANTFIKRIFKGSLARFILVITILSLLMLLIIFVTRDDFNRLHSLIGIVSLILFGYVFSHDKLAVKWRTVICGLTFQLLLGIFCIRWEVGRMIFKCLADKVTVFLNYSKYGAAFVFGDFLVNDQSTFAFAILPTIFFFSLCVSVLNYMGVMQSFIMKLGWVFQATLGTTVCESIAAAGNIFLSQVECPLLISPYIRLLTHSEIHSIIVSGFATVSGAVLAAYISYGAEAQHLITASVMAAPAALYCAKLFYPETEQSQTKSSNIKLEKSPDTSLLDAASNGAKNGIDIILNIIANLVAFIAFLYFADSSLKWLTGLLGFNDIGVEFLLGKLFMPVSWALGIEWNDCEEIGNVIGTKAFLNEFVAFELLGKYKRAGQISLRSSAIATYAICGFGNPSAMGIMIGGLSALAPERRPAITKVAFRALIAGTLVSLLNASVAGLMMTKEMMSNDAEIISNTTFI